MAKSKRDVGGLAQVVMALVLIVTLQAPREPTGKGSDGFSLSRAKESLASIAADSRPRGSLQHTKVREYLVDELIALGVQIQVQQGEFLRSDFISERAAGGDRGAAKHTKLKNILGTIHGTDPTGTVLLMAHYDSVVGSPGAGDDGSGVVAVLEAMRVLSKNGTRNDVLALFTDGEEEGLRGARLFAEKHPLFKSIDVVLNFESIGNGGPAVMFETGPDSGGLVDLWAEHAPQPRGNTLAPVIYGWLPNDTDFSVFRDAGIRGLNFAICGGSGAYHTPNDTALKFEDRSLAHMSESAIALGSKLAEIDLRLLEGGSRNFDSLPLIGAFSWSGRAHLWSICAILLTWLAWSARKSRPALLGYLRGFGSSLLLAAGAGIAAFGAGSVALALFSPELPMSYNWIHILLGLMICCALGSLESIHMLWTSLRARRLEEMWSACPIVWICVFAFFAYIDLEQPGASYSVAYGAGCCCIASFLRQRGWSTSMASWALVPAVIELGPILAQLFQLSSQDLGVAVRLGSQLIALGSFLILPVLSAPRLDPAADRSLTSSEQAG